MEALEKCFCGGKAKFKMEIVRNGCFIWCQCELCGKRTPMYVVNLSSTNKLLTIMENAKEHVVKIWSKESKIKHNPNHAHHIVSEEFLEAVIRNMEEHGLIEKTRIVKGKCQHCGAEVAIYISGYNGHESYTCKKCGVRVIH